VTPLPPGPFATIVADPPWPMAWSGGGKFRVNGRGVRYANPGSSAKRLPYATLTVDEIAAMPVESIAAQAAHLFLWAPDPFVLDGSMVRVARAWGFEPLRLIVWAKAGFGLGRFPRPQHELLLIARRGGLPFAAVHDVGSVQHWKLHYERVREAGSIVRADRACVSRSVRRTLRTSTAPRLDDLG
jgi:N6-adenosine-specific RNA methylase IME4